MKIYELTRGQINELKRKYYNASIENEKQKDAFIKDINDPLQIRDKEIYRLYADSEFYIEDFSCPRETLAEIQLREVLSGIMSDEGIKHLARFGRAFYADLYGETREDEDPWMCLNTIELMIEYLLNRADATLTEEEIWDKASEMVGRKLTKPEFDQLRKCVEQHNERLVADAMEYVIEWTKELW